MPVTCTFVLDTDGAADKAGAAGNAVTEVSVMDFEQKRHENGPCLHFRRRATPLRG